VNRRSVAQVHELELRLVLAGSSRRREAPSCRNSGGEAPVGGRGESLGGTATEHCPVAEWKSREEVQQLSVQEEEN
jgi:hypothetical protein